MNRSEMTSKIIAAADKYKYILLIILVGLVLIVWPDSASNKKDVSADTNYIPFSIEEEEKRISKALESAEGLGKTQVILTLNSTMETEYLNDTKETSTDTVILAMGSGQQGALITKRVYPEYRGALVICEGAASSKVQLQVINAVRSLTGLPSDKIVVISRKSQ